MTATAPENVRGRSFGSLLDEFVSLVVAYAKQETLDPIKSLGRFIAFGIVGALLLALGGGLLALAAIRAIQAETADHLNGSLTWVSYFGGVVVAGVGAGWAVYRITKGAKRK
jgi:sugar phosphate permease